MVESTSAAANKQRQTMNPRILSHAEPPPQMNLEKLVEARRQSCKQDVMDRNVKQFERKLKDFEQMFEYISPDLDFGKLDQALFPDQDELGWFDEDDYGAEALLQNQDNSGGGDRKHTVLTVQDKYGFIQHTVKPQVVVDDEDEDVSATPTAPVELRDASLLEERKNVEVEARRKTSIGIPAKSLKIQTDAKRGAYRKRTLGREQEDELNNPDMRYSLTSMQMTLATMSDVDPVVDRRRCQKWFDMLDQIKSGQKIDHAKLKSRARKGIPDSMRGLAWPILSKSDEVIPTEHYDGGKQQWMRTLLSRKLNRADLQSIYKDISRTLPQHIYFQEDLGTGQKALFAVLKCLALQFPDSGYVQGMGYLSATLMTYTTPEDSFSIMVSIFDDYKLKEQFLPGMPGLEKDFYILLSLQKKYMPALYKKFNEVHYVPQIYASQWFLTLYSVYFPFEVVVRIWDIYLVEGRKTIFRIALAILKLNEKELLNAEMEELFGILKEYKAKVDLDKLLKIALNFTFSHKLIDQLEAEYLENPKAEIKDICKLL